jgi:hypothetical protein
MLKGAANAPFKLTAPQGAPVRASHSSMPLFGAEVSMQYGADLSHGMLMASCLASFFILVPTESDNGHTMWELVSAA